MSHMIAFQAKLSPKWLREVLELTCTRLGLQPPQEVRNHNVGYDRATGKTVQATGIGIRLPNWRCLVVFEGDCSIKCDNYSAYHADHPDVKAGRKELGANGKWGDIQHLARFRDEAIATELMLKAEEKGDSVEYTGWNEKEKQVELVLIHA